MKRQALVTLCAGSEFQLIGQLTHPYTQLYSSRNSLSFIVLKNTQCSELPVHFAKYQLRRLLEDYERLLFVDTDILIHPQARDLIEMVPKSALGAYLASNHSDVHDAAVVSIQAKLGSVGWDREYFNSGVLVVSRGHEGLFDIRYGSMISFWEQTQLNYNARLLGISIFDVSYRFNHVQAAGASESRMDSDFIHYAGPGHGKGSRLSQIAVDILQFASDHSAWIDVPDEVLVAVKAITKSPETCSTDETARIRGLLDRYTRQRGKRKMAGFTNKEAQR